MPLNPPLNLAPGIHRNIAELDYHAINLCSNSRLGILHDQSPAHVKYAIDNPKEWTPSLVVGSALHSLVLAPDHFKKLFVVSETCGAIKKTDGKRCSNPGIRMQDHVWLCGMHDKTGRDDNTATVVTQAQLDQCQEMFDSIMEHEEASAIVTASADRELSVIFDEPYCGMRCKLRADLTSDGLSLISDIKTTESAHEKEFEKAIWNYGYHRQAAFYQTGLAVAGKIFKSVAFIVVEKTPPYEVAVYQMKPETIALGWEELEPDIKHYHECVESGNWHGYQGVRWIGLPPWAAKRV